MVGRVSRRRLLLAALPLLALPGCQEPPKLLDGPVAQIAAPKQITIVVPVPDKPSADRLAGRTQDYQQLNPNVVVDLRPITGMPRGPFDVDKWVDLLAALSSSAFLDATVGWDVWAPAMIDRGILRPLDPYLADIGRPLERYFMASSVKAFRRSGRVWMLPWQAQPVVVFYNRLLLDRADLPPPPPTWTWRDLEAIGSVLTSPVVPTGRDKTWGFDVGAGPEVLIYQNGGRIVDDPVEPIKPTLDEPPNVEAFVWVQELIKRLKIMPSSFDFRAFQQREGAFAGGQIAMRLDRMGVRGGAHVGSQGRWNFPWNVLPAPGGVVRATTANFQSWGILSTSTRVDESWGIIRHLCTRLPAEARIDGVPAFLALQNSAEVGHLLPEGTGAYLQALAETVPTPAIPAANTIQNLLSRALFQVVASIAQPAEALQEAQQAALQAWRTQPAPTPAPQPAGG